MRRAELVRTISLAELKLALGVPADNDLVIDDEGPFGVSLLRVVQLRQLRYTDVEVVSAPPAAPLKMPAKRPINAKRRRPRK